MNCLYPRLNAASAKTLAEEHAGRNISELADYASTDFDNATFAPTGGRRASREELKNIRDSITAVVKQLGYPEPSNQAARKQFDVDCGRVLLKQMKTNLGEGSRDEVWAFMSCILLPDCVTWRWLGSKDKALRDHFIGGVRNTFQRLWWRARILYDENSADPCHLLNLPEDALVQIMERRNMMADWTLSRSVAVRSERLELDEDIKRGHKEAIHRDAIKRIRQKLPLMNLQAIAQKELNSIIDVQFQESIDRIAN